VPDYRKRQGRQHRWIILLSLIAMALASAQRTPQAIARWVHEHRDDLFAVLPPRVSRLPSGATIRRALARLDVAALEQAVAAFHPPTTSAALPTPVALQGLAIDGKAVRGVGRDGHPCHLVSLVQHGDATVLGQVEVALKRDERSAVPLLLEERDLRGKVITTDALHTLRPTAQQIRNQQGHYLMIVKKIKPPCMVIWICSLPCPPTLPITRCGRRWGRRPKTAMGGWKTRRLTCGNAHIEDVDWPDVQQVVRRECERITIATGKRTSEGDVWIGKYDASGSWSRHDRSLVAGALDD